MTAINCVVQEDAAYLFTDTAKYSADGIVLGFGPKTLECYFGPSIVYAPPCKAVFAFSGVDVLPIATALLPRFGVTDMRSLFAIVPDFFYALDHAVKSLPADRLAGHPASLSMLFAGYDDLSRKPFAFAMGNEDSIFDTLIPPFTPTPIEEYVQWCDEELFPGRTVKYSDGTSFDPIEDGRTILEKQRFDLFGEAPNQFYGVGGQGILTKIDANGVNCRILTNWDDRVGERIKP